MVIAAIGVSNVCESEGQQQRDRRRGRQIRGVGEMLQDG